MKIEVRQTPLGWNFRIVQSDGTVIHEPVGEFYTSREAAGETGKIHAEEIQASGWDAWKTYSD